MNKQANNGRLAILYVDDEEKALKYFRKAFEGEYDVHTAPSVAAARRILDEAGDQVGILITDQRMPGETGVDLLEHVRLGYPHIIRIFTTAYSDLESAIQAVNSGGVFWYVAKPWNLDELRGVLRRAEEFYNLRLERDSLLAEKLGVVQQLLTMDRVRTLVSLAASLEANLRNPIGALKAYVEEAQEIEAAVFQPFDVAELDLLSLTRIESENMVKVARAVIGDLEALDGAPVELALQEIIHDFVKNTEAALAEEGVSLKVETANGLPNVQGQPALLQHLLRVLVRRISDMDGNDVEIRIKITPSTLPSGRQAVRLAILAAGQTWLNGQVASLYSALIPRSDRFMGLDMDLLSAYFLAFHHGGTLTVHREPPFGPGFEVNLACDAKAEPTDDIDTQWFDSVYRKMERRIR